MAMKIKAKSNFSKNAQHLANKKQIPIVITRNNNFEQYFMPRYKVAHTNK